MVPIQCIRNIAVVLAGLARCPGCSSAARPRSARMRASRRTWKRARGAPGWQISLIAAGAALRVLRTGTPVDVAAYRRMGRIKAST